MSGGCGACCAKDDANTQSSGSPSNLKDVRTRRTSHDGERGHRVTPTSLASLAGFKPSPRAEQLRDDPATQYGSGAAVRTSASDAADPGVKKKFDPNKFKRRIGDHLAAAVIEQQQRGEEERPLLAKASAAKGSESRRADADVELGVPVASREGEEKLSKKEKKKREIQLRRQEMRLAQRRCWKMLVAVMFAVILVAAALFAGGFSGLHNSDQNVAPREIQEYNASYIDRTDENTGLSAASTSYDPEDVRLKSTQESQEQFDSVGELEEEEKKPDESAYEYDDADDFNDPNLRTMAPKVWRKRQKMLDKVKRNARKDAKREVRDFVKNAHDVLGVKEEVKEQDYDDALIERIESSPGVTVEKRKVTKESPFEDEDGEDAALVAAQASTLSNNLITDTIDSTRHLHKLATIGPDDEHAEDAPSSKSSKNESIQSSSSEKDAAAADDDDEKKKRSASQSQAEEKKKEDVKKDEAEDKDKEESGSDKKERDDETKVKDEKKVVAAESDDDEEPDFELPPASRAWRAI